MNRDVQVETCSYCGGPLSVIRPAPQPHYGKLQCDTCGRHHGWAQTPDCELGQRYVMPFGKHRGKTLDEVATTDKGYLHWIASVSDFDEHIRKTIRRYLATKPAYKIREDKPVLTG